MYIKAYSEPIVYSGIVYAEPIVYSEPIGYPQPNSLFRTQSLFEYIQNHWNIYPVSDTNQEQYMHILNPISADSDIFRTLVYLGT